MGKKISIVGAGIGGLALAARLAKDGYNVEVYEKLSRCGGRNNIIEDSGYKFDTGPSFVLMPDFFDELFSYCGQDIKDYLELKALDISYKIFYADGQAVTVYRDSEKTKESIEKIERGASKAFDDFIFQTEKIYKSVRPLLYKSFRPQDILNLANIKLIAKIKAFDTYWSLAKKFFKSEKLCYAFTFEAMFMGVSPFDAPAFYSIISYTDHRQKIFHPMGGMYKIPLALEEMATKFGANFNYNSEVSSISKSSNGSVELKIGEERINSDIGVINADYSYAQESLLNRRLPGYKYSCSVLLFYIGVRKKLSNLTHHNLFLSGDLRKNLTQIFKDKSVPDEPSFYVHVPTVTDHSLAPKGSDILYVLVPVSNLSGKEGRIDQSQEQRIKEFVFQKINEVCREKIEDYIEVELKFYPEDFIGRYNIKYGATFGLAHNFMQSAFFRPNNHDTRIKNLYYVGASTQPGGGLPVVIASSKIVSDLIKLRG
ncbi:MAG: phytoene desaturase [Candidatus Omnitrophota bacterium]|jgi:phytoene desaturase|nr:MAG: phytoene desaturase [Candidatus Omnitrophota bacterium]